MTLHPVQVVGVRVELPAQQPVVLLKESDGSRYLPIWIGPVEASPSNSRVSKRRDP
jgi:bifunctional DNase/RNase